MIGVYGATGMLGRLVTARFDRAGAPATLIGRSRDRLASVARSPTSHHIAVAAVDDASALEGALGDCHVLVSCVPAHVSGERLVRAALDAGIHYVDAAGEHDHVRTLYEKYDDEATHCDVAVVAALGFDDAIGDCLAHLAAQAHQPAAEVVVAYALEGTYAGGSGSRAALPLSAGREMVYREGRWRSVPFELDRASFEFPAPLGRRRMSRYGSGEVVTVPRHVKTRAVTTLITSTSLCPYPALLPLFPLIRPVVGLLQRTPARALLGMAAPPRDDARFTVMAEAHGALGSVGRAIAVGGKSCDLTAAILAQGALWLAAGSVVAGVHSAATAFEPHALLDALAAEGVVWSQSRGE